MADQTDVLLTDAEVRALGDNGLHLTPLFDAQHRKTLRWVADFATRYADEWLTDEQALWSFIDELRALADGRVEK